MKKYKVVFELYREFLIEADSEDEAVDIATDIFDPYDSIDISVERDWDSTK